MDNAENAPLNNYAIINLKDFLRQASALGIPSEKYTSRLGEYLQQSWSPASIILDRKNASSVKDLVATHQAIPELRQILEPIIEENLKLFHLSLTDPQAYLRELDEAKLEAIEILKREGKTEEEITEVTKAWKDKRYSERINSAPQRIGELTYRNLSVNGISITTADSYKKLRSFWHDHLKEQVKTLLDLPADKFIKLAVRTLKDLDEEGRELSKEKIQNKALPRQLDNYRKEILELAFLEGVEHPDLQARLKKYRKPILNQLFHSEAPVGTSATTIKILNRLFPDTAERAAVLQENLRGDFAHFRLDDFRAVFGNTLTLENIANLNVPANRKLEILEHFRRGRTHRDTDARWIRKIQDSVAHDLLNGKLSFTQYMSAVNHMNNLLPEDFTPETVQFDRDVTGTITRYVALLREKPPEERYAKLKDAVFGFSRPQGRKQREEYHGRDVEEALKEKAYLRQGLQEILEKELESSVKASDLHKRLELFLVGMSRKTDRFTSPEYVDPLFDAIMSSPLPESKRLEMVARLRPGLRRSQTEKAWSHFSKGLYASPYNENKTVNLVRDLFGDQADQVDRKMNDVFHFYKMSETQMDSLRERFFPKDEIAGLVGMGKLIRAAIRVNMTDPASGLEFLKWLHGKTKEPPPMAKAMEVTLGTVADGSGLYGSVSGHWDDLEYSMAQRMAKGLTLNEIRDIYQRNNLLFRMVVTADLLNPLLPNSITHTTDGQDLLIDYITEGMDVRNVPLAKAHLSAYLEANDQPGDNFLDQIVASSVKTNEELSDAVKIRDTMKVKGGLWVKMGQQAYADRLIIQDEEVREVFAQVLDHAEDPNRPDKYKLLKEAMGDEFVKIKQVHETLGSGSINATFLVELIDGNFYVARLVQGDPDTAADHERIRLAKTSAILKRKAQETHDLGLRDKLLRVSLAIDEYIPVLADKMRYETDLSRERGLSEMLRDSYNKNYEDLGVKMELLTEASTIVQFGPPKSQATDGRKLANPERLIFYPVIQRVRFNDLSRAEQERVRHAMYRAEWEAIFTKNTVHETHDFDPDGHKENWLYFRDPADPSQLRLVRIDYSQGESLATDKIESLRALIGHTLSKQQPVTGKKYHLSDQQAFDHMRNLLQSTVSPTELKVAFEEAMRASLHENRQADPVTIVSDVQARLKLKFGESLRFDPGIVMAIKSMMTIRQHMNPKAPRDNAFQSKEFARIVLRTSPVTQRAAGLVAQAKTVLDNGLRWIGGLRGPSKQEQESIEKADATIKLIQSRAGTTPSDADIDSLVNLHNTTPNQQERILDILRGYYLSDNSTGFSAQEKQRRLLEFLRSHDPDIKTTVRKLIKTATDEKLVSLFRLINANDWQDLYAEAIERIRKDLSEGRLEFGLQHFLSDILPYNGGFFAEFNRQMLARREQITLEELFQLDRNLFKEIWAELPHILERTQSAEEINKAVKAGVSLLSIQERSLLSERTLEHLRADAQKSAEELAKQYSAQKLPALETAQRIVVSHRDSKGSGELYRLTEEIAEKIASHGGDNAIAHLKYHSTFFLGPAGPSEKDTPEMLRDFALHSRDPKVATRALKILSHSMSDKGLLAQYLDAIANHAHVSEVRTEVAALRAATAPKNLHMLAPGLVLAKENGEFYLVHGDGKRSLLRYGRGYLNSFWENGAQGIDVKLLETLLSHLGNLGDFVQLYDQQLVRFPPDHPLNIGAGIENMLAGDFKAGTKVSDADIERIYRIAANSRTSERADRRHLIYVVNLLLQGRVSQDRVPRVKRIIEMIPPHSNEGLNAYLLSPDLGFERPVLPIEKIWEVLRQEGTVTSKVQEAAAQHPLGNSDLEAFAALMGGVERSSKLPLTVALIPYLQFESPEVFLRWHDSILANLDHPTHRSSPYIDDNTRAEREMLRNHLAQARDRMVGEHSEEGSYRRRIRAALPGVVSCATLLGMLVGN